MHASKIALLAFGASVLALCAYLAHRGHPAAGYWFSAILPPFIVLAFVTVRTWGSEENRQGLSLRRLLRTYFYSHGWWVLFWLVLIFVVATFGG